jgi:hypothetical protein
VNVAYSAEVVTVTVLVSAAPAGVRLAGEKEHAAPSGNPVHARVTDELKPLSGVTDMVAVPDDPSITVSDGSFTDRLKSVLVRLNWAVVEKPGTVARTS